MKRVNTTLPNAGPVFADPLAVRVPSLLSHLHPGICSTPMGFRPSVGTHAPPDSEALEALRSSWWTYVQSRDFQTRPRRSKFYPNNWDGLAAWTCDYNSWKKHRWLFLSQPIPSPIEVKMSEKESFWGDAISFEVKIHDFIKCLPWQVDWGYTWASRHKSIAIHTHPQGQSPSRERWHTWNTWAPHGELIWVDHCVWVHLSRWQ